jgi:tetratricopeptide (TPR) repeat protein
VGLIAGLTVLSGGDSGGGERSVAREAPAQRTESRQQERPQQQEQQPQQAAPEEQQGSGSPAELNDQGFALMNEGRHDEAIPVLQQAVAGFPEGSSDLTLAYALYNLGRSLRLAGRPDEAIPVLERRLEFSNQRGVVKKEIEAARREAGVGGDNRGRGGGGGEEGEGD